MNEENINNYHGLIEWFKSLNPDYSLHEKKEYEFEINKDEYRYVISFKKIDDDNSLLTINKNKILTIKEIQSTLMPEKDINSIKEQEAIFKNKFSEIIIKVEHLKNDLYKNYDEIIDAIEVDCNQIINDVNKSNTDYEEIIDYTTDNLIRLSKNFNFIEDISVRIHLISINAAIESAKTGEQGKGFAVISREIAKLSNEIKDNTKLMITSIKNIQEHSTIVIKKQKFVKSSNELSIAKSLCSKIESLIKRLKNEIDAKMNNFKDLV